MHPPAHSRELAELRAVFDRDHARVLELLADVQFLCARGSYAAAAKVFAEFRMHQEQHLRKEEALLGKLVTTGRVPPALVAKASSEHAALRDRIGRTWDALSRNERIDFEREVAALSAAVDAHEHGEKEELLPVLWSAVSDANQLAQQVHQIIDD